MLIAEKRFIASAAALLFLGAVILPCVLYTQSVMDGMHVVMPIDGMQQKCCTIQPVPHFHAVLQSTAVHDVYRNTLLLISLLAAVTFARVVRARTENPGNFSAIREFTLRQAKIPLSGFERLLQRGIVHPRLYEPAVVFV